MNPPRVASPSGARLAPPAVDPLGCGASTGWHLLSIREIAEACQLSEKAVRRAIDAGELPAFKLRSRLRVTPQDFHYWVDSCRRNGQRGPANRPARRGRPAPAGTFRALVQSAAERGAER